MFQAEHNKSEGGRGQQHRKITRTSTMAPKSIRKSSQAAAVCVAVLAARGPAWADGARRLLQNSAGRACA